MQLLFDFFPVIAFFVTFKFAGIYVATAVLIVAVLVQTAIQWFRHRKVSMMALTSAGLVLVFGGLTLWLQNELLIKLKVTVLNWLLAAVFLGSHFIGERPIVERMMSEHIKLERAVWLKLSWTWIGFFAFLGALNLYIMNHFDTDTWANFKMYGMLGLTVLFALGQAAWLATKMPREAETQKP